MGNETEESQGWLSAAMAPSVIRRASAYAGIVGANLILINHGGAVLTGNVDSGRLCQMGLTAVVPYIVSTLSSVGATRERQDERR